MADGGWDIGTWDAATWDSVAVVVEFDTHDGDKFREKVSREKAQNQKRRDDILATFERLVEGKQALPAEITQPYIKTFAKAAKIPEINNEQINKLMADLDNMQQIWEKHIETDDEEVLALL